MTQNTTILGINAYHGDSSAALFAEGQLRTAVEEERFNRIKHWAGLPVLAANECLREIGPVEHVALSRNPRALLSRKLARVLLHPSSWKMAIGRAQNSVRLQSLSKTLEDCGVHQARGARLHFVEHHRAHMASAFFASPFSEAAVVSVDGFGDFSSIMWGVGRGNKLDIRGRVGFPHSLGAFYTAFTQFLGFPKYGDEYKMMGLAAYGEPHYLRAVRDVVRMKDGPSCELNLDYFRHHTHGAPMTWDGCEPEVGRVYSDKMCEVFGEPRVPRSEFLPKHADLAASVQAVLEECYFKLLNEVHRRTGCKVLCLAGGVALNCAANGKIFENTPFREVYVQAAAHDAGTSIGAALYVQHQILNQPRSFEMRHAYYGPRYDRQEIRSQLNASGAKYRQMEEDELVSMTAREIASGKIVGWFQNRMEFGPRALGNRSILADPRRKDMTDILNGRIKFREFFRPFCPSILAEATGDYFTVDYPSPFMVQAYSIKPSQRDRIPAVTHADGTGRLQTVDRSVNALYWRLIDRFREITGVPVLLNTSFNENEPIVNTPQEALECFRRTDMDLLVIGPFALEKSETRPRATGQAGFTTAGEEWLRNKGGERGIVVAGEP